jgi:hypothetical protein
MKFKQYLTEGDTEDYLKMIAEFRNKNRKQRPEGYKYASMEEYVLANGKAMGDRSPESDKYKKGKMKLCFMNAYQLASSNSKLKYCEGFATSIIPTMHAWCIDQHGNVIDVTWKDGRDYFGVEFPLSFVSKTILARGKYGVIDNMEQRFPLLKTGKIK